MAKALVGDQVKITVEPHNGHKASVVHSDRKYRGNDGKLFKRFYVVLCNGCKSNIGLSGNCFEVIKKRGRNE